MADKNLNSITFPGLPDKYRISQVASEFSLSKAYGVGEYVNYLGKIYKFTSAHSAGAWNGSDVAEVYLGNEVADVKSALDGTNGIVSNFLVEQKISPNSTQTNVRLSASGNAVSYSGCKIIKYNVTPGEKYLLNVKDNDGNGTYQFQSSATVPSSGNSSIIGSTKTSSFFGFIVAPVGATHLIVGITQNTPDNGIYYYKNLLDSSEIDLQTINDTLYDYTEMQVASSASEWRLNESDGLCSQNASYKLIKYQMTPGEVIKIVSDDRFQFQNSSSVPSSGTNNKIGKTYGNGVYYLQVPEAATYLIMSTLESNGQAKSYFLSSKLDKLSSDLTNAEETISKSLFKQRIAPDYIQANTRLKSDGNAVSFSGWNIIKYNVVPGNVYHLYAQSTGKGLYQFQNELNVPTSDNSSIIGGTNTDSFAGIVEAPEGSTYLIVGLSPTETDNGLYITEDIIDRNKDVLPIVNAASYFGWNSSSYNTYKRFSMLVTTDVHGDSVRFNSAIKYLNNIPSLDAGICLGDIVSSNYSNEKQWYLDAVSNSRTPFYTVIGNHDGGNSTQVSISATVQEMFNTYIEPTLSKIGLSDLETPYYSIQNDNHKIVLIMLDNYDVPDTISNGAYVVSRGVEAYSQAQINWLINTLNNVPSDYHVIVCMHYLGAEKTVIQGDWTRPGITFSEVADYPDIVTDIINAWINGSTLSNTYTPSTSGLFAITVNADFTSRGTGIFCCYLFGHTHKDAVGYVTKYSDQKFVCLSATANDKFQNYDSDLPRAFNTKSEDCLTVFVCMAPSREFRLVRVGANVTNTLTTRTKYIATY